MRLSRLRVLLVILAMLVVPVSSLAGGPRWTGANAENYRAAYSACRVIGLQNVARQLHAKPTAFAAATAEAKGKRPAFRAAEFAGCYDGLRHAKPALPGNWTHWT